MKSAKKTAIPYRIPSESELRTAVEADMEASGLTLGEYAERKDISRGGLSKFLRNRRGATLDFARKLIGG